MIKLIVKVFSVDSQSSTNVGTIIPTPDPKEGPRLSIEINKALNL